MHYIHELGTLVVLLSSFANGALYPTTPVQTTIFTAGMNEILRWRDDSNEPHVSELSKLTIQLVIDDDLVSTLATDINPMDYAAMINIPPYVGADGFGYYIRFIPQSGDQPYIYTSDFAISGLTGSASYREAASTTSSHTSYNSSNNNAASQAQDAVNPVQDVNNDAATSTPLYNAATTTNKETWSISSAMGYAVASVMSTATADTRQVSTYTTTPFSLVNGPTPTAVTATYVDTAHRNAGSARFQRPSTGNGIGTTGLIYLLWPVLMGVAMALVREELKKLKEIQKYVSSKKEAFTRNMKAATATYSCSSDVKLELVVAD
ncbi:hypothetical protein FRB96_007696 [Tulasnella sp. 330]|nr:hypothetical protein FRB96_007696 [Tulasnella sp. 330]